MTAQVTLQCLSVNYPKPITAKLLNNQSQAWEMMLSQHAMPSQSQAWEVMLSQHAMQLTLSIKEPAEAQNDRRGQSRDFSCSLA